ncbi:MAG: single-stranded-DNA-specific exonuclease RecJ [Candidatus Paceibacterota bacterium]|jgi:single-stranded-DNA-specific exonuclease
MHYTVREKKGDIVSGLLYHRGIQGERAIADFLSPNYEAHTHDPFLMKDMDRVVARLYKAVKDGEKIVVFSDYDADGIPGAVVLHDLLKKIGYANFENYIPHRHDEGFGLNMKAVEGFKEKGMSLIITIDCGIADIEETAKAKELGMDLIITDHHEPHGTVPDAFAILNPKTDGCMYPEKMLCGSGVIFKLAQAFLKKHGEEFGVPVGWEKWWLDMVGIATLSDMVPLVGENRAFAHYGLKVLRMTKRPGLLELFSRLRVKPENLTEDDIGFTISPRINAASRMGEPEHAFLLLSTDDRAVGATCAERLEEVNNERKGTVASLVKEVRKILAERDMDSKNVIVLGNPTWRPSLMGLVANKLAEEYGKPAFLWGRDGEGVIKGSCRSGAGASVFAIMEKAHDAFTGFGGHAASGGFEVKDDAIHYLEERLEKAWRELDHTNKEVIKYADALISVDEVVWDLYKDIERLSPFGTGNARPIFLIKGARVEAVKQFGKEGNHTEITLSDRKGRKLSAIQFFLTKEALPKNVVPQALIDIAVHLEKSMFKSYPELRLRIVDII